MINTKNKMYDTNAKIKKYLKEQGFTDLYLFPHSRFMKDYHLDDCEFDAIGWKQEGKTKKQCWVFQFKTNEWCPKKQKELYKKLNKKYNCIPCWITVFDKKRLTKTHPNQIEMCNIYT